MKDSSLFGKSRAEGLLGKVQRLRLVFACVVLVFCFLIANDVYGAKAVSERHKQLLNGPRRMVDYSAVVKQKMAEKNFGSDLNKRYLIDPKAATQPNMISVLSFEADTCNQGTSFITTIPFSDTGTTTGKTDDYNLSGDPTACPAPACVGYSGDGSIQPPDRGYTYIGTGLGPDVAYKIAFTQPTNLQVIMDPLDSGVNADDLALVFYTSACTNNPSDAIIVADNSGYGGPGDNPDNAEIITFSTLPNGIYNIVVDAYSYATDPPTNGPYTLTVTCAPGQATCRQPGFRRR